MITQFQSTLPHGSDIAGYFLPAKNADFNPRSLTGAIERGVVYDTLLLISIHAPSRERSIKTKYFYIHLNQAFIANQLNSNP